jgi:hypothetical protein
MISSFVVLEDPEFEGTGYLRTSGVIYPATQRHIPEDLNLQQSRCENVGLANTAIKGIIVI